MQKESVGSAVNEVLVFDCRGEAAPQVRGFPMLGRLELCTVLYSSRPAATRMQQMTILSIVSCGVRSSCRGLLPKSLRAVAEAVP